MSHAAARARRPGWAILFLAGPVIWYLHFWLVYLVAEAGCAADDFRLLGLPGVSVVTVVATVVAVVAIGALTVLAYRRLSGGADDEPHRPLVLAGCLMGVLFLVATLFVGTPAVMMTPC